MALHSRSTRLHSYEMVYQTIRCITTIVDSGSHHLVPKMAYTSGV